VVDICLLCVLLQSKLQRQLHVALHGHIASESTSAVGTGAGGTFDSILTDGIDDSEFQLLDSMTSNLTALVAMSCDGMAIILQKELQWSNNAFKSFGDSMPILSHALDSMTDIDACITEVHSYTCGLVQATYSIQREMFSGAVLLVIHIGHTPPITVLPTLPITVLMTPPIIEFTDPKVRVYDHEAAKNRNLWKNHGNKKLAIDNIPMRSYYICYNQYCPAKLRVDFDNGIVIDTELTGARAIVHML
jgi:hypothetical protein